MEWVRKSMRIVLSLFLMFVLVQYAGGYLIHQLSQSGNPEQMPDAETQIIKQMVLQLDPVEYYTFQLGVYPEAADGQVCVNQLAELGYRVCVSDGPPYEVWLGCMGKKPQMENLPDVIRARSVDIFVKKRILNETSLKFLADDGKKMEQTASLISSYDVVLRHFLQMFQDFRYTACSEDNWNAMTEQIEGELKVLQQSAEALSETMTDKKMADEMNRLLTRTKACRDSLNRMKEEENDRAVLLAQSCLMELIEAYHRFIKSANSL